MISILWKSWSRTELWNRHFDFLVKAGVDIDAAALADRIIIVTLQYIKYRGYVQRLRYVSWVHISLNRSVSKIRILFELIRYMYHNA